MKIRNVLVAGLAVVALPLGLAACSSDPLASGGGSGSKSIVVGSANFPESELLATIYAQALTGAGIDASTKLNIGSREVYFPALKDGSIDLLPEYTGATLSYLDPKTTASASDDVTAALGKALPSGIEMLTPSDAQDSDVLAVTKETAAKYSLTTISDLAPVASQLVLGGPPEWKTRQEGVVGLRDVYGLNFASFKSLDVGGPLTVAAIKNGQVAAGDLTSTDPVMEELVALQDDKHLFPAQNIVPLIASGKNSAKVTDVLNKVSSALTTKDLIEMNRKLGDKQTLNAVAAAWLKQHDIK
jgi:osmoprotectant transport system substrate-binding protein